MTDIKLPKGYEDWEELPDHVAPHDIADRFLEVHMFERWLDKSGIPFACPAWHQGKTVSSKRYYPPKPKPTLPDVKPGAVIRYTDGSGKVCRAVLSDARREDPGRVFTNYDGWIGSAAMSDDEILADVNADGFAVELEGL